MSNIYHAKLNINERIFEVYKEVVGIEDLLRNLFKKVSSDIEVKMIDYSYHFADLSFDEKKLVIYGRLAKVFRDKELNIFDSKEKRIHTSNVNNATDYVAFAFDVMQEIIYFCPVKSFGRKEFIEVFAELIEKSYEDIGYVKINLLLEQQKFEDSFSKIEKLRNFSAIIIPPNAGSDDIFLKKDLLKSQMIDANAKEVGIYLKSDIRDPIKKESKLVRLVKKFASNGYGYLKVDGRDSNNNEIQIDTEEDKELQKRTYINSSLKNSSVAIYEQIKNTER